MPKRRFNWGLFGFLCIGAAVWVFAIIGFVHVVGCGPATHIAQGLDEWPGEEEDEE